MAVAARYWAVIPAAGGGRRMQAAVPKQYMRLHQRALIEWSAAPFIEAPWIGGVVVVLARGDRRFSRLPIARHPKVLCTVGGATRADSVLAGLRAIPQEGARDSARTFVLVHDAARPCVDGAALRRLRVAASDRNGGLLAIPQSETVKLARGGRVLRTVDRRDLWRAQTPQLFRLDLLQRALADALRRGAEITDEASAMEAAGFRPRLVPGEGRNLKVTYPEDLELAALWLAQNKE